MAQYETIEEEMNALMNNTHSDETEDEIAGKEKDNEETQDPGSKDENIAADDEETDHNDDESKDDSGELDTEDQDAGSDQENNEADEDKDLGEDEDNARAEDGSSEESDTGDETKEPDVKTGDEGESKDGKTATDGADNGSESENTSETDYKKQYDDLLKNSESDRVFREKVTSDFKANGRMVAGITDPDKIIQSNQMSVGLSDKLAGYKKFRPFMSTMKDIGFLDNPEEFNRMVDIYKGDENALKSHIKGLQLDPVLMDLDDVKYESNNHVSTEADMTLDDVISKASSYGIKDKVENLLFSGEKWDRESVVELLNDKNGASASIVEHMSNDGRIFNMVQDRIDQKKRYDSAFAGRNSFKQYQEASWELEGEYNENALKESEKNSRAKEVETQRLDSEKQAKIAQEKTRIEQGRKDTEYKNKVQESKLKADEARKKATAASEKKSKTTTKKKANDNGHNLKGDDFKSFFNGLMS